MALNYIWVSFFIIAFVIGLIKLIIFQDTEVFALMMKALFDRSKLGFELSIGLTGILVLWMGIMKIGEKGGVIDKLSKLLSPVLGILFPEIPKGHPAFGSMMMNFSANMIGLDNAATPLGLKAMDQLQELNPKKDTASNAQIMFLVMNTSGLTLIPVSIIALRVSAGSENPLGIFIPILMATFISTLVGIIVTGIIQRLNLKYIALMGLIGGGILWGLISFLKSLSPNNLALYSQLFANILLFGVIILFILMGLRKKINIYDSFIEGAKDGFGVAIKIIPYLVAMLAAIGVFTASGAMEYLTDGLKWTFALTGMDTTFVDAIPTAIMKPLSGSGARALMVESWTTFGVDSFVGQLTSVLQGSTETTFYVLAVYFGAVNIKNTRYAAAVGLLADLAGVIAAIIISYYFFIK
jgi:spore maturation protein SpmA